MGPKGKHPSTGGLFRPPLTELINLRRPLVRFAELIDWLISETRRVEFFPSRTGCSAGSPRLISGLLYLQHKFACSDKDLIWTWDGNPYWQNFCGASYFQHEPSVASSSMARWRKRIGEEGVEWLLTETLEDAHRDKLLKTKSFEKIIIDTTVMEKTIAYPTDSRLLECVHQHLVKLAGTLGIKSRHNHNQESRRLAAQAGSYAHARQFQCMKARLKSLRTLAGLAWRDIERKLDRQDGAQRTKATSILTRVKRLLEQKPKDKNKLYSLHAPEVDCISKGKARQLYGFCIKVTVANTHKEVLVVGMRILLGNPYYGHTLPEAIGQFAILTDQKPEAVFVDKGYRGGGSVDGVTIRCSAQRRGVTLAIKKTIHRRRVIEPVIGRHVKNEGKLRRNWFKGGSGDALNAALCSARHNLQMILGVGFLRLDTAFPWPITIIGNRHIRNFVNMHE